MMGGNGQGGTGPDRKSTHLNSTPPPISPLPLPAALPISDLFKIVAGEGGGVGVPRQAPSGNDGRERTGGHRPRSEEHTSELHSPPHLPSPPPRRPPDLRFV